MVAGAVAVDPAAVTDHDTILPPAAAACRGRSQGGAIMPVFRTSRFTVAIPIDSSEDKLTALYQTMTGAFILIPAENWSHVLSNPGDPETIELLREQGFLVKQDVDEAALFDHWKQQQVHDFS